MNLSQIVISSEDGGSLKFSKSVLAFTEYGVIIPAAELNSKQAIRMSKFKELL